jgi:O-antigen ligase
MSSAISVIFTVIPVLVAILVSLTFVGYAGATLVWPRLLLYPYIGILFCISSTRFGNIEGGGWLSLYTRGTGTFYFALLLWLLLVAMLWAQFSSVFKRCSAIQCNLLPWFLAWTVLLIAHVFIGLYSGVSFKETINPSGFSNIPWMAVFIITILLVFRNQKELVEFSKFVVLIGLARAVFGVVRWVAFGGDPNNAYENYGGLDIKLTFFDINDSLVCWLALCVAIIQLFKPCQVELSRVWRFILWMTVVACIICIILSFRRTVWFGLILGGSFLLMQLPPRQRIQIVLLGIPAVLSGVVYSSWKRFSQTSGAGGLESMFYDLQSKDIGADTDRLLELKLVWSDFTEHLIFGIGSWGRFKGHEVIEWQAGESAGSFVHSGILHIALKSGLFGLVLLAGLMIAFSHFWLRKKAFIGQTAQPLAVAGVAGILFMLPDLIIGTPIPQLRTTQMVALCMALPYLAYGVGGNSTVASPEPLARHIATSSKSDRLSYMTKVSEK